MKERALKVIKYTAMVLVIGVLFAFNLNATLRRDKIIEENQKQISILAEKLDSIESVVLSNPDVVEENITAVNKRIEEIANQLNVVDERSANTDASYQNYISITDTYSMQEDISWLKDEVAILRQSLNDATQSNAPSNPRP